MKTKHLLPVLVLFFLISNIKLLSQPQITNYYHYNDVFSIAIDETNNEIWLGTKSGVLVRDWPSGTFNRNYTKDDGLSSNFITAIAIDNYGNKWFGSFDNGVSMYDGTNFTIYNSANSNMSRQVNSITVESTGEVWFASPDGVRMFDGSSFTYYSTDNASNPIIGVSSIYADGNFVYIAAESALFLFNVTDNSWTMYPTSTMNVTGFNLTSVVAVGTEIYVGTNGAGIAYFNGTIWQTPQNPGNLFINNLSINLLDNYISAATQTGIYYYNTAWTFWSAAWVITDIKAFAIDNTGGGWAGFGLNGNGIDYSTNYNVTSATNFSETENLSKSDINDIKINPVNNDVLIATEGGGLTIFDGTNWFVYKYTGIGSEIPSNIVRDISVSSTGDYWCATDAGVGLYNGTWTVFNTVGSLPSNDVRAVEAVSSSNAWVGTDVGASYYNASWANYTQADGMMFGPVISITVDNSGNIWCLHINGVSVYNGSSWSTYSLTDMNLNTGAILTEIDNDVNTGVWISSTNGIARYNGTAWETAYTTSNSNMASNDLISVFVDDANVKHFGSKDGFILIYDDTNWATIKTEQGLATSVIKAVCFDNSRNSIWSGGPWGGLSQTTILPLSVTAYTTPTSICQGDAATLQVDVTGGFGNYSYSWTSNPAGFTSSNQTETVYPNVNTTYFVTVTDDFESQTAQTSILVTIPSFINGPTDVCNDDTPQPYWVNYNPNRTYGWFVEGGYISGDYNEQIDVIWDKGIEFGKIQLTEYDATVNCSVTQTLEIKIHPNLTGRVLRKGDNLLISLDSGMVYYQWYRNEFLIEGANQQFYAMPVSDRGGFYYVELKSDYNCYAISETITITSPSLKLYPNPTASSLSLEFINTETGNGIIQIKDLNGKTVLSKNFVKAATDKKLELNLTDLLPGVYNLDVFLNDKFLYSEKIVKN